MYLRKYMQKSLQANSHTSKSGRQKSDIDQQYTSSNSRRKPKKDSNKQESSDDYSSDDDTVVENNEQPHYSTTTTTQSGHQNEVIQSGETKSKTAKSSKTSTPKDGGESSSKSRSHTGSEHHTQKNEHQKSKKEKNDTTSSDKKNREGRKKGTSTCEEPPETSVVLRTRTDGSHATEPDSSAVVHHRSHGHGRDRKSHGGENRDYSHLTVDSKMLGSFQSQLQGLPPKDHTMVPGGVHWQMTKQTPCKEIQEGPQATMKSMVPCFSQADRGQADWKGLGLQKSSWDISHHGSLGERIQGLGKPLQIGNVPGSTKERMLLEMGNDCPMVVRPRRTLLLPAPESSTDHHGQSQPRSKSQTPQCWYNTCDKEKFSPTLHNFKNSTYMFWTESNGWCEFSVAEDEEFIDQSPE